MYTRFVFIAAVTSSLKILESFVLTHEKYPPTCVLLDRQPCPKWSVIHQSRPPSTEASPCVTFCFLWYHPPEARWDADCHPILDNLSLRIIHITYTGIASARTSKVIPPQCKERWKDSALPGSSVLATVTHHRRGLAVLGIFPVSSTDLKAQALSTLPMLGFSGKRKELSSTELLV